MWLLATSYVKRVCDLYSNDASNLPYGLRSREVAALTLDDIDWERQRLRVPERKAGHSTAYPLSPIVGEAIVDYLKNGRPQKADRRVFYRVLAPCEPMTA